MPPSGSPPARYAPTVRATTVGATPLAEPLLAEIHIRMGEPRGLTPAHQAIETVSTLQSLAARRE